MASVKLIMNKLNIWSYNFMFINSRNGSLSNQHGIES